MSVVEEIKKREWLKKDARLYDSGLGDYAKIKDNEIILELINKEKGIKVLDIPCGSGRVTKLLLSRGFDVTAADYSEKMLKETEEKIGIKAIRADIFNTPFKDNEFDLVISLRILFHYPNPEMIIKELCRVTKPKGTIIIDVLNKFSLRHFLSLFLNQPLKKKLYFFNKKELHKIFKKNNLKILDCRAAYVLPTRFYRFLPKFITNFIEKTEKIYPEKLKILTYLKLQLNKS